MCVCMCVIERKRVFREKERDTRTVIKTIEIIIKTFWKHGFHLLSFTTVPIKYRSWQVLYTASSVHTELMKVSFCWSANIAVSMCLSLKENVVNEFVPASIAVPSMSWMVWKMRRFVGCCFQDLIKTARSVLVEFLSYFIYKLFVRVQVVQP